MPVLEVRTEVVENGAVPTAPWLSHIETAEDLQALLQRLLEQATTGSHGESLVSAEAVGATLDISPQQTKVLLEVMAGAAELQDQELHCAEGGDVAAVQPHCLALFLAVHHYLREAQRAETADVWPADYGLPGGAGPGPAHELPSSPMRMTARSLGREQAQHHRGYLPAMRQQLQDHLALQESLAAGLAGYVARHAELLLQLASARDAPVGGRRSGGVRIARHEFDRLHVLLRPAGGWGASRRPGGDAMGSPMDVCGTPFADVAPRLADHTPFFSDGAAPSAAIAPVASWLAECLRSPGAAAALAARPGPGAPAAAPPPPPACEHITGVSRATVVRGESDLPPLGRLRVADCHGAVVYALAPLRAVLVTCCRDCVVVLGAVGALLRLERCERVQVVAATRRTVVNTCHDCILYMGTPSPPLLLGDSRFVQLGPYNTGYERLAEHCAAAGVRTGASLWDRPLSLQPGSARPAAGHGGGAGAAAAEAAGGASPMQVSSQPPAAAVAAAAAQQHGQREEGGDGLGSGIEGVPAGVSLLPPEKLMPFAVPFRGGPGALCGGPAASSSAPVDALSSLVGVAAGEGGAVSRFPSSPFPLPPAYAAAWEAKMRGVASVRAAVKSAGLEEGAKRDLMAAIQAQFKEWLHATGAMRHVYDLARLERDEGCGTPRGTPHPAGDAAGSGGGGAAQAL